MSVVLVVLGLLVAFILAVMGPWALLRKLDREGTGRQDGSVSPRDRADKPIPDPQVRDPR